MEKIPKETEEIKEEKECMCGAKHTNKDDFCNKCQEEFEKRNK